MKFTMQTEILIFETIKLGMQFGGALLIARLAVSWALKRYKSEKAWERKLAAYVDAVTALSEMKLVVGRWIDELEQRRSTSPDWDEIQYKRYQAARRRLDEGVATALLLLPAKTTKVLTGLTRSIDSCKQGQDQHLELENEYDVLNQALKQVIEFGRENLGPELLA
jgi:hypothetical protein